MSIVTNIEDLRRIARRKIPRAIYDYVERGSYDEITLNANRAELNAIRLRQRVLIDVSKVSLASSMLGEDVSMPVAIAPTGLTGLVHGDGETLAARAAEAAGIKFCLSDHVDLLDRGRAERGEQAVLVPALHVPRPRLQPIGDRTRARSKLFRAVRDRRSPHARPAPRRHQERADRSAPPDGAQRFRHCDETRLADQGVAGRRKTFGNVEAYLKGSVGIEKAGAWSNQNFDRSLSWRDVEWVRGLWPGKLVLKGVLDVEDAKTAASAGVDGIVVSNHGGRQLDGAHSTIRALP